MTYDRRKRRNERGVALLFALGILAMLLMLGLGFVTNAVISQRIAANNSTRAQARIFARSAAARAMTALMLYCDQASADDPAPNNAFERTIGDLAAFRSRIASGTAVNDQLTGVNSKLNYAYDSELADYRFKGEEADAQWIFFYDDAGDSDRKIVGRAAWTILPRHAWQNSSDQIRGDQSRISLYGVLGGSAANLKNDRKVVPWDHRWGRDIDELFMENSTVFNQWRANGDNTETPPYTFDVLFSAYREYFGTDSSTPSVNVRKAWVRKWFSEGYMKLAKEAYAYVDSNNRPVYLHRFNVGDYMTTSSTNDTDWHSRFASGTVQNMGEGSDSILERLAAPSRPWHELDVNDNLFADSDKWGLPFLTRIGNDPWSFENITNFRKQIAANFNDYCDNDNIPTSNLENSSWSVETDSGFPAYTGNEKTDYINEIALSFNVPVTTGSPAEVTGTHKFAGQKIEPQIANTGAKQDIFVETVRIYDDSDEDGSVSYTAAGGIRQSEIDLTCDLKYSVQINYTDAGGNDTTATVSYTAAGVKGKMNIADTGNNSATSAAMTAKANGYRIGKISLSKTTTLTWTGMAEVANQLDTACKNHTGNQDYTVNSVEVTMDVRELACKDLQLTPTMLSRGSENVDFVRWDKAGTATNGSDIPGPKLEVETLALSDATPGAATISLNLSATPELKFIIAGFEAKDPRQNLNPMTTKWSTAQTSVNSDWIVAPKFMVTGADALSSDTVAPTMTFNTTAWDFTAGKVNTGSSPASPAGVNSGEYDAETVSDPAWLNETASGHISTAHVRNQPMKSLWEIGMIHRARPWQTLNITRAAGFTANGNERQINITDMAPSGFATLTDSFKNLGTPKWDEAEGTSYTGGDGGILEMVKLTQECRAFGKLDINLFKSNAAPGESSVFTNIATLNQDIIKALFLNIRGGQTMHDFINSSKSADNTLDNRAPANSPVTGNTLGTADVDDTVVSNFTTAADNLTDTASDPSLLRSKFLNTAYGRSGTVYTFNLAAVDDDASREEIIGKTINLLGAGGTTIPNIFKVLIVAQSINDIGGTGEDVEITKVDIDGDNQELQCRLGRFDFHQHATDPRKNLYFDEITGETKLVATIERDPESGQMVIRQLEYVE